eukprot:7137576-Pyramimonas_sp.AAC.1
MPLGAAQLLEQAAEIEETRRIRMAGQPPELVQAAVVAAAQRRKALKAAVDVKLKGMMGGLGGAPAGLTPLVRPPPSRFNPPPPRLGVFT